MDKIDWTTIDPRRLIAEAYRIDAITLADCRSIFLDWAIGQADGTVTDLRPQIELLLTLHGARAPDHPMTQVLRAGLDQPPRPRRRGGRAGRVGG